VIVRPFQPFQQNSGHLWLPTSIAQQQTIPTVAIVPKTASAETTQPTTEEADQISTDIPQKKTRKQQVARIILAALLLSAGAALYFIWGPVLPGTTTPDPGTADTTLTQQSVSTVQPSVGSAKMASTGNTIQVYVLGAIKHPGVYILPTNTRVYQLLDMAGGPLPGANLVSLNLAAKLNDGEVIYITRVGEKAPTDLGTSNSAGSGGTTGDTTTNSSTTSSGTLVNINTASATELRQSLHVSATTANAIINYRMQHGPYASVDQLTNVVSTTIYNRIKDLVTVE